MSISKLSVGIVGLPNVGKSTLFNALLKKQASFAEATAGQAGYGGIAKVGNYPFCTIEPNVGVVPVPDFRLTRLAEVIKQSRDLPQAQHNPGIGPPIVPATVTFTDIAGIVKGASQGEGLGNKFLSHIREADAICFVLRAFRDPDVIRQGVENPKNDFEVLKTELDLADLETKEKHEKKKNAEVEALPLFSKKPFLVVLNIDEDELSESKKMEAEHAKILGVNTDQVIAICAKTESELCELSESDQKEYLSSLGIEMSALDKLISRGFEILGLQTFLTAPASADASARQGGKFEVRAWTIRKGMTAVAASGVIHTDFMKKFIKAEIVGYDDFVALGGWKQAREAGKTRQEGRDYIMQDGDVVEFKIGA